MPISGFTSATPLYDEHVDRQRDVVAEWCREPAAGTGAPLSVLCDAALTTPTFGDLQTTYAGVDDSFYAPHHWTHYCIRSQ